MSTIVAFRLDSDVTARLREIADNRGTTVSDLIRQGASLVLEDARPRMKIEMLELKVTPNFADGTWVTEYAVCVVREHGERTYHNETASHDMALDEVRDWQRDGWYDAHIVTCQVFRTEWQPLPEGETK